MNWNVTKHVEESKVLTIQAGEGSGVFTNQARPIWVNPTSVQVHLHTFVIVVEKLPAAMKERNLNLAQVRVWVNKNKEEEYFLQAERYLNELKQLCINTPAVTLTKSNVTEVIQALAYGRQRLEESSSLCVDANEMQKLHSIRLYQDLVFDALEGHGYDLGTLIPKCYETMTIPYYFYDEPLDNRKKEWDEDLSIPLGLPEGLWSYCEHAIKVMQQAA